MSVVIHTIPVPIGWSPEQAWEAIRRGDLLEHPEGEPGWVNIQTGKDDRFLRVLTDADLDRSQIQRLILDVKAAESFDRALKRIASALDRSDTDEGMERVQSLLVTATQDAVLGVARKEGWQPSATKET